MDLTKLNSINELNKCVLASNVFEYDIEHANADAIKIIKGEELYNHLISLPKLERNVKVGLMIKDDKSLGTKIDKLLIDWRNKFIEINNIKKENILEVTKDSVLIKNVIPKHNQIPGYDFVNFRTKNEEYSSYIRIDDRTRILYDSLKKKIKIKGVNDEIVNNSMFVKKILIPLLQELENSSAVGYMKSYKNLQVCRMNYITSDDYNIYSELLNQNKFLYKKDNQSIYSDYLIDGENDYLDKGSNYINFVLPLFRIII